MHHEFTRLYSRWIEFLSSGEACKDAAGVGEPCASWGWGPLKDMLDSPFKHMFFHSCLSIHTQRPVGGPRCHIVQLARHAH